MNSVEDSDNEGSDVEVVEVDCSRFAALDWQTSCGEQS